MSTIGAAKFGRRISDFSGRNVFTLTAIGLLITSAALNAQPAAQPENAEGDIIVYGRALPQIGIALSGSAGVVGYQDFYNRPLSRVGELAENVPGLIATQHSGTGKANQYFLRGFNLDHGSDLAGFVDGVPINMRSHGHGQGYLDLNFLIPELVKRIDYRKGPYYADVGDFSAAGTLGFTTVRSLAKSIFEATIGSFGYYRALAAGSTLLGDTDLLVALDGTLSNGPWDLNEDLHKINGVVKLSRGTEDDGISLGVSVYHADWQSSDQIPQRAIASGLASRFGNIDPYLGGRTTRVGATLNAVSSSTSFNAYAIYYDFGLTSNFTYFLDDPINGDEFQQRDRRGVFGGSVKRRTFGGIASIPAAFTVGADARYDLIGKIGLYHSQAGIRDATIRQDKVREGSGGVYGQVELWPASKLRLMLGLRGDLYGYDVDAQSLPANSGRGSDAILGPKFALAWQAAKHLELYANYGESFHSNDVRGASIRVDPKTDDPVDRVPVLVKARGAEVGARAELGSFSASVVGYYLALGSELVFVGDGGGTEPNDPTRRYGTEATLFWRPTNWLALDGSAAFTHARFHNVTPGQTRISNSVTNVISGGAAIEFGHGLSGSLRVRHFGAAPLIEDDSARSKATTLVNLGGYWEFKNARLGIDILNLFNARNSDITYFYTSRLPGEPGEGVDDYHLHPVEPRQVRVTLRTTF